MGHLRNTRHKTMEGKCKLFETAGLSSAYFFIRQRRRVDLFKGRVETYIHLEVSTETPHQMEKVSKGIECQNEKGLILLSNKLKAQLESQKDSISLIKPDKRDKAYNCKGKDRPFGKTFERNIPVTASLNSICSRFCGDMI